ncbi:C40 family peptidase [Saccharomonospora sp. NPDC006951]
MTLGDEPPATSGEEPAKKPGPRRRTMFVAVLAAVAAVAAFVVALQLAPGDDKVGAAAMTDKPATPPPATAPPSSSEQTRVPEETGPRFEAWVDDVAGWLDIPQRAMHAYAAATVELSERRPDCNLSWVTLAGIGKTASDHGRENGGKIGEDGKAVPAIGTIELRDFGGNVISIDGAAGPMQLSPALWDKWGPAADAKPDVQNLDDAALATGEALCADGRDLADGEQWLAAVSAVHDAPLFLHRVLATANVYGTVGMSEQPPDKAALTAVTFAIEKIGLPYEWGGNGNEKGDIGFDCSGLTTAAYAQAGLTLQRTAHWQYTSVPLVPADEEPRLGDLIFYGDPATKIHHVGIYIGNQQMIDAPTFGQAVQVHDYRKPGDSYAGAGRPSA